MQQGGQRVALDGERAAAENGNIHRSWRRWSESQGGAITWWDDAQLVEGTTEHLRHVCGLHQHGQGMTDDRKPEPVWLPWKKVSTVLGAAPHPGTISISITCPFLGEGAQRCGQPLTAAVAQEVKL